QAFNNTMFGPWKKIADGYGKMVLGYFGKTPVAPDAEVVKIAQEQLGMDPTDRLVVDINDENPNLGIEAAKKLLSDNGITDHSEENIFIAAACLDKGIQFLKGEAKANVRKNAAAAPEAGASAAEGVTVTVNGRAYGVKIDGGKATVNGKSYDIDVKAGIDESAAPAAPTVSAPSAAAAPSAGGTSVNAPMPGLVLRIPVAVGDVVDEGDEVMVLEAMKMETPVSATVGGTITAIVVNQGDQVKAGETLVEIG
ncbi:MAG: biotin/lipoyl-containing protein, partial [Spirochaetaceae bacterium]|nr:biotin/lipoyl-containing protein [Spirochaetaceae bacterium]